MISAISSGLQGLNRAETQVNQAASQISRSSSSASSSTPSDTVDLSSSAVQLLQGKNDSEANLKLIKVADEMQKTILHL